MNDVQRRLSPPPHGGELRALAADLGISADQILDFSANINPVPPPEPVRRALSEYVADPRNLTHYPDIYYSDLKESIARYAAVPVSSILVANGVMPLLQAIVSACRMHRCLIFVPAFTEYRQTLSATGTECLPLALPPEKHFEFDVETALGALRRTGCDGLLLANPHSPSGFTASGRSVAHLAAAAGEMGATTIVDEAFIDYVPEESVTALAPSTPHLIVLRSLTKFFAIPGFRVAYAVAALEAAQRIQASIPLWPVDTVAAKAAELMLGESDYIDRSRASNATERTWLNEELCKLGLYVHSGQANFLLVKAQSEALQVWKRLLIEHRIAIRSCANFEGLDRFCLRIAVRGRHDNRSLVAAFGTVLHRS